ncbi:hypothetical protein CB1_000978034 [Camelus ferus]|nr:hypothetical protein CB1_000978034 [Camelus ferus]
MSSPVMMVCMWLVSPQELYRLGDQKSDLNEEFIYTDNLSLGVIPSKGENKSAWPMWQLQSHQSKMLPEDALKLPLTPSMPWKEAPMVEFQVSVVRLGTGGCKPSSLELHGPGRPAGPQCPTFSR